MRLLLLIWACPELAECVSSKLIFEPNVAPAYTINCLGDEWAMCYCEAGIICRARGYEIMISQEQPGEAMRFRCKSDPRPIL
jgi:hypothetical protein